MHSHHKERVARNCSSDGRIDQSSSTPQRQLANMARVCALGQLSPLPLVVPLEDLQRLQVVTLHRGLESHSLDHGQPHHEHLAGMDR